MPAFRSEGVQDAQVRPPLCTRSSRIAIAEPTIALVWITKSYASRLEQTDDSRDSFCILIVPCQKPPFKFQAEINFRHPLPPP